MRNGHQWGNLLFPHKLMIMLAFISMFGAANSHAGEVRVAVASNFIITLKALSGPFERASGHTLKISSASTGKLYAQIKHGAPFAVFMAADTHRPELLEKQNLTVAGSRFTYAQGQLVLWIPKVSTTDCIHFLQNGNFKHLAIANPKTAPYGLAAQQFLQRQQLWTKLQSKLVRGENISQTFQFVLSGNAQVGLVARSQFLSKGDLNGCYYDVPQKTYSLIEQQVVLLKSAEDNQAAIDFIAFLQNEKTKSYIRQHGYEVP